MQVCQECNTNFHGRSDAKFCSDMCRNAYNNRKHSYSTPYIRKINSILRKNRRILQSMNPDGKTKMPRQKLISKGFDFTYHTNTYTSKKGNHYFFCYEEGYMAIDEDWLVLVRQEFKT